MLQQSLMFWLCCSNAVAKLKKKKKYARMLLFIYYFVIDRFNYETYMYVKQSKTSRSVGAGRDIFCGIRAQVESFLQTKHTRCSTTSVLSLAGKLPNLNLNKVHSNCDYYRMSEVD